MPAHANGVRLGHTLGDRSEPADDSAVRLVVAVANGDTRLEPRLPVDPTTVLGAERILGALPRPVYAFVGSLHPDLGCVGLVLSRTWASRSVQGVTRCDSGGLFAGRGAFGCLVADESAAALVALSTPAMCAAADWEPHFAEEIDSRHPGGVAGYVAGDVPNLDKEERIAWWLRLERDAGRAASEAEMTARFTQLREEYMSANKTRLAHFPKGSKLHRSTRAAPLFQDGSPPC